MDEAYRDAMREHFAQLAEELAEIEKLSAQEQRSAIVYRATERNLQLLIEACIGVAKQTLKDRSTVVPGDARKVFEKLKALGLDSTNADWQRVIGMRNALVHDYLNLDRERILEVVRNGRYQVLFDFASERLT